MKILSFVEGTNPCRGGTGIGDVHEIMSSLVKRGHEAILNMSGFPNPGTEDWVQPDALTALECEMGSGNYGIFVPPCVFHRWSFLPTMLQSIDLLSFPCFYAAIMFFSFQVPRRQS